MLDATPKGLLKSVHQVMTGVRDQMQIDAGPVIRVGGIGRLISQVQV